MTEIRNKVKESGIITIDLADFKPAVPVVEIDVAEQLWQGIALREKEFREWVAQHDWSNYANKAVFVHCSADAIVPTWAYMLIASKLSTVSAVYVCGTRHDLERQLIRENIQCLDLSDFTDGRVMIKGCSDISDPAFAMTELLKRLQPVVKSIMYGEPCSAVPVFKRK